MTAGFVIIKISAFARGILVTGVLTTNS